MPPPIDPSTTTIVLVHGAWHHPRHYQSLVNDLQSQDYQVECPVLPSVGSKDPDCSNDVAAVREVIEASLDRNMDVALVMHSYGGIVGTLASEGFAKKALVPHGVVRLIYMASFLVHMPGGSLNSTLQDSGLPSIEFFDVDTDGSATCRADVAERTFYNDVVDDSKREQFMSWLRPQPVGTFIHPVHHMAYKDISTAYIVCTKDATLLPPIQEAMVSGAEVQAVVRLDAGHSPWASRPVDTKAAILKLLEA